MSRVGWSSVKTLGLLDNIDLGRTTFYGKRLKVMQFNDHAVNEVIEELGATIELQKDPFDFCKGCSSCPYSNSHCEFKSHRLQQEQKDKNQVQLIIVIIYFTCPIKQWIVVLIQTIHCFIYYYILLI